MEINLSTETINTVYNALKCSKQTLEKQLSVKLKAIDIIKYQLAEVEDALVLFEELVD